MLWVLVGLGTVELLVTHLLLALLWSGSAAAIVSLLTGTAVLWLAREIAGFGGRPVLLAADRLVWRVGRLRCLDVPLDAIAGPCAVPPASELKARHVANCALVAHPNIALALSRPLGPRGTTLIAHRLDDPHGFLRALASARASG